MARASYIYLAVDRGRVVSAFTVKHEAITAIAKSTRTIELYRIRDGHWSPKLEQAWERVLLD